MVEDGASGAIVRIRVRPRSSRRGVLGVSAGALSVGVAAPPEGGKATAEAIRTVAGWLGIAPSRVRLISGETSRSKRLLVGGTSVEAVRRKVSGSLGGGSGHRGERRPDNAP